MRDLLTGMLVLLALGPTTAGCTSARVDGAGAAVPVWGRWEATFVADSEVADPDDLRLIAHLTSPRGDEWAVDGFWDGGNVWKVRFMPDEAGTWRYRTETTPHVEGLNDRHGTIAVEAGAEVRNRFLAHGSVRVSSGGRYLEHADGTPFLWIGDTAWNGALMSSDEAWEMYLEDRVEKGFSGIQFVTTQWRAADGNAEGERAYTGFDDIEIHPRFFDRIDERINAVNAAGLLAAPVLLWTLGEPERNPGKLPEDQAIKLARYLTARYGAHHVMWFLAGDENFEGETGARWRRIGRAVFDEDVQGIATLHPRGRQWFFDEFADEDWLDVIIYQSSHGGGPQTLTWLQKGPPAEKWRQDPVRPIINSEPGYEDHVAWERDDIHTADDVRPQLYWSLLNAPTAGVTYGAHGIWSWETAPSVPLNHDGSGLAKPWYEAKDLPGSEGIKHLANLFTSIEWWTLRPAADLVQNQADDPFRFIGAAASPDGRLAVLYLPVGGTVQLDVSLLTGERTAQWYSPREGVYSPAESRSASTFAAPDSADWVLIIE